MMMSENMRKSRFSLSYIEAVASHAGFQVVEPKVDEDSVDGILMGDFGKRPRIEFQAKATSQNILRPDGVHFDLPVKNYEELRLETIVPRILIVMLMPDSPEDWLNQSADELCLRRCAYWRSLRDEPATSNSDSVMVRLPTEYIFDSDRLRWMMEQTERTGAL